MTRTLFATRAAAFIGAILLCACGFQLKGQHHYAFKRLYIAPSGAVSPMMVTRLSKMITAGGDTVVVDDPNIADATLSIVVTRSRTTSSLNVHGAAEEYALEMSADYALTDANGAALLAPGRLTLRRSMTYNDQYALAKATESEQLYRDIENDVVDQLIRRLASVRTL